MPVVLVVDDRSDTALALQRLFERAGFEAIAVLSGEAAIDSLRGQLPDVVILDYHMPGMSGCDVLDEMQRDPHMKAVPVVIYSADMSKEASERALRLGARDFLVKGAVGCDVLVGAAKQYAGKSRTP